MKRVIVSVIIGLVVCIGTSTTRAATVTWDGSGDMTWSQPDSTSWSGATYYSGDDVVFAGAGGGTIVQSGTLTPRHIIFTAGTYIFTNLTGSGLAASGNLLINGPATALFGNMANVPSSPVWTWGTTTIQGGGALGLTRPSGFIGSSRSLVTLDNGTLRLGADNFITHPLTNPVHVASGGGTIVAVIGGNAPNFVFPTNVTGSGTLTLLSSGGTHMGAHNAGLRFSGDNSAFSGRAFIVSTITTPTHHGSLVGGGVWFDSPGALFANAPSVTVRDGGIFGVGFAVTDAQLGNVVLGPRAGLGAFGSGVLTSLSNPLAYVTKGGNLVLDNTAAIANRYDDTMPLTLDDIRLVLVGRNLATTHAVEAVGPLSVQGGASVYVRRTTGGSGAILLPSSIETPTAGNTLLIESLSYIGASMTNLTIATLGSAPSVVNGMITPAIQLYPGGTSAGDFATLLTAGGTQFVARVTYTTATITTAGPTDIVNMASAQTLGSTRTVHALRTTAGLTITSGNQLTIGSGGLIMNNQTISGPGTLNFGGVQAVIGAYHPTGLGTITAPIAGSGGLTIMGTSQTLNIMNETNSFTGGIVINGGAARFAGTAANNNPVHVNTFGRLIAAGVGSGTDTIGGLSGDGAVSAWIAATGVTTGILNIAVSSGTYTFDGYLMDGATGRALGLTKSGAGTQVFSTNCIGTFSGPLTISNGTLVVDADFSLATGPISLVAGATLGGSGKLGGTLTTGGGTAVIAPGSSPGRLTLAGSVNLAAGATFEFELGSAATPGTTYDQLAVGGTLTGSTASGGLRFNFTALSGFEIGTPYTLITYGSRSGLDYTDFDVVSLPSGYLLDPNYGTGGWLIGDTDLTVQFIPEPSTATMILFGLVLGLMLWRRRRA